MRARNLADWDLVLTPQSGWLDWRIAEIWGHRDLLRLLIWRDFVTAYKQTILGPFWHVLNPILTALTFTLVFGRVVRLSTNGLPPVLFYMGGIVAWNYFNACFFKTSNSLAANAGLFGKVYFHRLVVPLSVVISSLIAFAIQLTIFAILIVGFALSGADVLPNAWILMTPYLVLLLGALGLGLGLISSALTTRYRDLGQVITFGMQLLMFATPIIYPLSATGPRYRWILKLNPLTPVVETFRFAALGHGEPDPKGLLFTSMVAVVLLTIAISVYMRVERTFVDTV